MDATASKMLMVVIFGRPGAGKSTVSQAAVRLLDEGGGRRRCFHLHLDLDVCVPQWMRDNFSRGIYPTLRQRAEFISSACNYVKREIDSASMKRDPRKHLVTIVSFSFVNTDLRATFRESFPHARWILVDTGKQLAGERIAAREGHFYKSASSPGGYGGDCVGAEGARADRAKAARDDGAAEDNSEWEFRPVDFPHVFLDGRDKVGANAGRVVEIIERHISGETRYSI